MKKTNPIDLTGKSRDQLQALLTSTNTEIGQLEDTVHRTKLSTNSRYMELRRLKLRLVTALDENKSDGARQTNLRRTMPAGGERRRA